MAAKTVCIVGGGVIGLHLARELAGRGHAITVLDRGSGAPAGASFVNAGILVPSHFVPLAAPGMVALGLRWMFDPQSPFHIRPRWDRDLAAWAWHFVRACTAAHVAGSGPLLLALHLASRALYAELAAASGNAFGLEEKGLLVFCRSAHGLDEEARAAEQARRLGLPADVLTAYQAQALEPEVRLSVSGAVHYPLDCHLSPARLMAWLADEAARLGADVRRSTEVTGLRTEGNRIAAAVTPAGEVAADAFVLAGGAWSPLLARGLGLRLPMQAGKGYSLTLEHPARRLRHPAILAEARAAVTPLDGGMRFGGTMEIAGLDESVDPARVRGIVRNVPTYFPEFGPQDFAGVPALPGLRPVTPDGLPYLGRTARAANLLVAAGHAMLGVSLGPITARLVAEILAGEPASLDIARLSPDRYA